MQIILTMDNILCPCVHKTTMHCLKGLSTLVHESALNAHSIPFDAHWASTRNAHSSPMHTPFTSSQTTSNGGFNSVWPFELVSRVSTWPQTWARDSYHEKSGNNSVRNERRQLNHKRTANERSHCSIDWLNGRSDGWDWVDCGSDKNLDILQR